MPTPPEAPAPGPSRRAVLRLLGLTGLSATGAAGLAGCSAADRDALLAVDPRQVRLDDEVLPGAAPDGPSARELRRRAVRGGSLAALAALAGAAGTGPALAGRTGGAADPAAAAEVHRVHAGVLAGAGAAPAPAGLLGGPSPAPTDAGPALPPGQRPEAVLSAGTTTALRACAAELSDDGPQVPLALLHARVAAARSAQASGLRGTGAVAPTWPTTSTGAAVVDALQGLLAQEHRARWSYAVVLAWSTDRTDDAAAARSDHARSTDGLADLVRLLGAEPVGAAATYPTDDAGRPVDGPVSAAALALRLEDGVAAAAGVLVAATVADAPVEGGRADAAWLRAAVRRLAEAERARWSWGGAPVPWPGG